MAVEPGIGTGIWEWNDQLPSSTDLRSEGDNHLRGIKAGVKNTFPFITAAIKRTTSEINTGTVPAFSSVVFWNPTAPVGWTREPVQDTYMLRVVTESVDGRTFGGTDNPIVNGKVPPHAHAVPSFETASSDAAHTHTVATSGAHQHVLATTNLQGGFTAGYTVAGGAASTPSSGAHTHTINSANAPHTHTTPVVATENNGGANAVSWYPRYLDVILCQKNARANP